MCWKRNRHCQGRCLASWAVHGNSATLTYQANSQANLLQQCHSRLCLPPRSRSQEFWLRAHLQNCCHCITLPRLLFQSFLWSIDTPMACNRHEPTMTHTGTHRKQTDRFCFFVTDIGRESGSREAKMPFPLQRSREEKEGEKIIVAFSIAQNVVFCLGPESPRFMPRPICTCTWQQVSSNIVALTSQ